MINEEIISYIKNAKEHGLSLDQIRINLKTGGWNDADISEAFTVTERSMAKGMVAPMAPSPQESGAPLGGEGTATSNPSFESTTPYTMPVMPKKKNHFWLFTILIIILLVLGGTGFAFYKKIIPLPSFVTKYLDKPPYDEQNLISGLIFKIAQIKTAKYNGTTEVSLGPKDIDAKPLVLTGDLSSENFDQTEYFPTEFKFNTSVTTEIDFSNLDNSDWKINFDTSGDFGDLYYQINVDSLQKGKNLYFKVNNLPPILPFPFPKSQWFLLDFDSVDEIVKQHLTEEEYAAYQSGKDEEEFQKNILEYEAQYKQQREKIMRVMKKFVLMADEHKILAFKEEPLKDATTAVPLYRYNLVFRAGTLEPFIKAFFKDVVVPEYTENSTEAEELLKELDSENPSQIINYIEQNTSILLWVDQNGFPESVKIKFRLVPGNGNANLNEKQINFSTSLKLISFNEPLNIEAPANAKNFFQYWFDSLESANVKANNAQIMSSISQIRPEAEIFYDNKGNYGTKTSGGCAVSGTIFASPRIANLLNNVKNIQASEKLEGKTVCYSNKDSYAISTPLIDVGDGQKYFCADSTGAARQTRSHVITTACPNF